MKAAAKLTTAQIHARAKAIIAADLEQDGYRRDCLAAKLCPQCGAPAKVDRLFNGFDFHYYHVHCAACGVIWHVSGDMWQILAYEPYRGYPFPRGMAG